MSNNKKNQRLICNTNENNNTNNNTNIKINNKDKYVTRKVVKSLGEYQKIFSYHNNNGKKVTNKKILEYINNLKIPPAYQQVKINLNPKAKLLVTGFDVKGKKQYIYNEKWVNNRVKKRQCKMIQFGKVLPKIEKDITKYLNQQKLDKNKLISLIIRIIMLCNFRIGNQIGKNVYNSYGITTITKKHIILGNGNKGPLVIDFIGKRGKQNICHIHDNNIKKIIKEIYHKQSNNNAIFAFKDKDSGDVISVSSSDVNEFLKNYGEFTSKDFRTWYANTHFIDEIVKIYQNSNNKISDKITQRKRDAREAIKYAAEKLHHTVAVCKKKYLNTELPTMYIENPEKFEKLIIKNYKQNGKIGKSGNSYIQYLKTYC